MNIINNKKILISGLIIVVLIAVAVVIWYYYLGTVLLGLLERDESLESLTNSLTFEQLKKEDVQKQIQLQELDKLKQELNAKFLTEKEIQAENKEMEVYRKKNEAKPLTQEEIQKQLEELNKLRSQSSQ